MDSRSGPVLQVFRPPTRLEPEPVVLPTPSAADDPDELFDRESLRSRHIRRRPVDAEPFSLAWFEAVEALRHGRHGAWLAKCLEFHKHAGESLLGLGDSLGTDWLRYARHGSVVTACAPPGRLEIVRRNFQVRGVAARFVPFTEPRVPIADASIDVVCLQGLLPEAADPRGLVAEVFRVLRPGGKVLALVPARRDLDYWLDACQPWQRWVGIRPRSAGRLPGSSRSELRRWFLHFSEHRIQRRHLRRADIPHVVRWLPPTILQRYVGRFMILKAFRPVRTARSVTVAA